MSSNNYIIKDIIRDKIIGMLIGGYLGDALGAPYEFTRSHPLAEYTGNLDHTLLLPRGYGLPTLQYPVGLFTDDSQMDIYLTRSIIENNGYNKDKTIIKYMDFANQSSFLGRNTRQLLKIKTMRGYNNRVAKYMNPNNQSNGSLMRVAPLAIFKDYNIWILDSSITNISQTNYIANIIFVQSLRYAIEGKSKEEILYLAEYLANHYGIDTIITAINQAKNNIRRNVDEKLPGQKRSNKGWVVHGIYSAFWSLYNFNNYKDGVDQVVLLGGDTDTNAKIAGNLLGAFYGYEHLYQLEANNINILFNANSNYLYDFNNNVERLAMLYQL